MISERWNEKMHPYLPHCSGDAGHSIEWRSIMRALTNPSRKFPFISVSKQELFAELFRRLK
jgi:hypothetical protein